MSLDIGTLVGYLKLDTSGVGKGIRQAQEEIRRGLGTSANDSGADGKRAGDAFGRQFSDSVKRVNVRGLAADLGKGLVAGLAVGKAVDYLRDTIRAASSLNETVSKSRVIFGANSAAMEAWAAGAVKSMGLSRQAALENAASFGDMFAQLGFGQAQAVDMSKAVVGLAADLGSFNNLGTDDVLERIAAGFRGEYDSLQKLIPNISAARVEQEALAATGKTSASALTAQEKATATLAIVQKDGARAVGDFARTIDGAANSEKIAAATAEELKTKIGQQLLPAWTALVKFTANSILPALSSTVDMLVTAGDVVGPLVSDIGELVGAFRDLPGPLQGAIVGLLGFLVLRSRFEAFGTTVKTSLGTARSTLQSFGEAMTYAGLASERAGGGLTGFAAGARTFTGSAGLIKGAASGLLGIMGGPWGLAFTGAVAVVGHLASEQADARRFVDELSDSLDKQTGALTDNTRAAAAKRLQDKGILDLATQMAISVDDVTSASLGQADAQARVNAAVKDYLANAPAGLYEAQLMDAQRLTGAIGGVNSAVDEATRKAQQMAAATGEASSANKALTGTTTGAGQAAKIAANDFETMADRLDRLRGIALDARAASRDYEQALDDLADAIKTNGKTLDTGTKAGRDNQAALDNLAERTIALAKANLEHGDSLDKVNGQIDKARDKFIEQATRLGMSKKAAGELADQLGITRGAVSALADEVTTANTKTVKVTIDRSYLNGQIEDIRKQLASLSGVVTVKARLDGAQLKNELHLLSHGINPDTQANGGIRLNGVRAMASGDITRQAMIFRSMDPILWNEAPGGEAYIPLAPAKRARSLAIWQRTGQLLGAGNDRQAGGNFPAVTNNANVHVQTVYLRDAHDVIEMARREQVLASYGPAA